MLNIGHSFLIFVKLLGIFFTILYCYLMLNASTLTTKKYCDMI